MLSIMPLVNVMKFFIQILFACCLFYCTTKKDRINNSAQIQTNTLQYPQKLQDSVHIVTKEKMELTTEKVFSSEVLEMENVLFNGHDVILKEKEFKKFYQKIDSSKTHVWECGNPFGWLDKEWMAKTYGPISPETRIFENFNGEITTVYCKNITFTTNNHLILFDFAFAKGNHFTVKSHDITLNENTTVEEFRRIFPDSEMETLENPEEVRFRLYVEKNFDDAFLFYFKNGRLEYYTLWWLLC